MGLQAISSGGLPSDHLTIFLPNRAVAKPIFLLSKHHFLPLSSQITSLLMDFLDGSTDTHVVFLWFSTKWVSLLGQDVFCAMALVIMAPTLPLVLP